MCKERTILFCFPYAGGTADFFNDLENECGDLEFCKLEYPGHGLRMKEPLCRSFEELTDVLYPQILEKIHSNPNCRYALFGYSMGSIALFDVLARIVRDKDFRFPCAVFISAHQPKTIVAMRNVPEDAMDEWVKARTVEFGGVDNRLLENSAFWRLYLPIYKNDYTMISNYCFNERQFTTSIPMTVFYSEEDTPYIEMKEWTRFFEGDSEFVEYGGGHFFLKEHYQDIAQRVINKIRNITE